MAIRLLALDLDDTLLDETFHISETNREAIRRAAAQGIQVTLATGRMFRSALPYALELNIELPLITYHGALIRTIDGKKTLYHRPVPMETAREVVSMAIAANYHINIYVDDELFVAQENEYSRYYQNLASVKVTVVKDLCEFMTDEPTKLTIINREGNLLLFQKQLLYRFKEQLAINISRPNFLEITDKHATKGQALAFLGRLYGIPREEMAAVGDSYNDLDMLEYAGLGVAMGNARKEVKTVAQVITDSNVNHGVAAFIDKYLITGKGDTQR